MSNVNAIKYMRVATDALDAENVDLADACIADAERNMASGGLLVLRVRLAAIKKRAERLRMESL